MSEWKNREEQYGSGGKSLFLGKWKVADISWDGVNRTDDKWIVYLLLPGLKSRLETQYKNIDDAMEKAEQVVNMWIAKSGIKSE
jgi:hypothetical protein